MAEYTTNFNLEKQQGNDYVNINGINGNLDIIDTQIKDAKDKANNPSQVNGHTVESDVPLNAKFTDTIYTHPATHPPAIIAQDASNRFVTDAEKTAWNAKAPTASPAFTGTPTAPNGTDYTTSRLRNIQASTTDLTAGSSSLANGALYIVYE